METAVILLVEDDELDIISVQRSLNKMDVPYQLHIAFNGTEALAMLREHTPAIKPDVILLDLNMPKMNGIEFLKIIRGDEKLKDSKVFIMTTSNDNNDRAITNKLGAAGYIIKPLNYSDNTKKAESMEAFVQFHLRKILAEAGKG